MIVQPLLALMTWIRLQLSSVQSLGGGSENSVVCVVHRHHDDAAGAQEVKGKSPLCIDTTQVLGKTDLKRAPHPSSRSSHWT